ncbi:MAG: hypothetical protein ABEH66_04245 [Halobacteriales archaeon]
MVDPVLVGIVVAVLLFFFFIFLMIRRAVTGFKEGVESGEKR